MKDENSKDKKKLEKPNIEGFLTPAEMGLNYDLDGRSIIKLDTQETHLKEHFNAGAPKISDALVENIKQLFLYGVKKIAPGYTIEVLENQLDKLPSCNDFYPCTVIKIKETGDQYKIGPRTYKYIGNGHKKISEPSIHLFEQTIKRIQELSDLTESAIPRFGDSILDPVLETVVEGECAPSETDFFMGLVKEAEQIITAKGSFAGIGALDQEYIAPNNTNAGIIELKQKDERFDRVFMVLKEQIRNFYNCNKDEAEKRFNELKGKNKAYETLNALVEGKYDIALSFAKNLSNIDYQIIYSSCKELKKQASAQTSAQNQNHAQNDVSQNSINKSKDKN